MSASQPKKIAIIGAGSSGTALTIALGRSRAQHRLALWVHSADVLAALRERRENSVYLPGHAIPEEVALTSEIAEAIHGADLIVGAMPSAHARAVYTAMLPHLQHAAAQVTFVSTSKGLEQGSLRRMTEVIGEVFGSPERVAALSGPSFALEVARGDPTAVVIAARDAEVAREIQEQFSGPTLRLYTNDDVAGVELGGAVKNVIAIAAGVCAGLGLGANTIASLITRGLTEMTRLAIAMGGRRDTLAGLAGLGDLVPLAEILAGMRMVAEGVSTTAATLELARRHAVEMPIAEQMHAVLDGGRPPREAIRELMERRLKQE